MSLLLTAAAICVIAALAAAAQAVSGFGFAMLSVPLMIPVLGAPSSVVVATVLGFVLTIGSTVAERRNVEWRPVLTLSAVALIGVPIGLAVLQLVDPHWLSLVIGIVVIGATVLLARRTPLHLDGRAGIYAAGVLSGALLSSTGMNGPPVVAVFQARGLRPLAFRASLQAAFVIQDVMAIVGFVLVARLTPQIGLLALIAVPALGIGWWLGDRLFHRIGQGAFRWIVLGMLLLSGLLAVIQAAVQLSAV